MRWPSRIKPKEKDTKVVVKFAYIPVTIGNVVVWLERYEVLYACESVNKGAHFGDKIFYFTRLEWVLVSKRVIDARA